MPCGEDEAAAPLKEPPRRPGEPGGLGWFCRTRPGEGDERKPLFAELRETAEVSSRSNGRGRWFGDLNPGGSQFDIVAIMLMMTTPLLFFAFFDGALGAHHRRKGALVPTFLLRLGNYCSLLLKSSFLELEPKRHLNLAETLLHETPLTGQTVHLKRGPDEHL